MTVRGALAVAAVQLVYNFHSVRDHSKCRKSAAIEGLIVAVIDEDLRRSRVWPCCRKRYESAMIALHDGIVFNGRVFPDLGDLGVRAQSKLRHESRQNAEKARA